MTDNLPTELDRSAQPTPEDCARAAAYLKRTGNADLVEVLGLGEPAAPGPRLCPRCHLPISKRTNVCRRNEECKAVAERQLTAHMTLDDRTFLREAAAGRIYRSLSGCVMQRGRRVGVRNQRVEGYHRKAVAAGWMNAEPDAEGIYRLTGSGRSALAARELVSAEARGAA